MNEQYKIGEAKFFLVRMKGSVHDRESFRYYMSAFLAAARSVIQYAREETKSRGRQQWFTETIAGYEVLSHSSQSPIRHRFSDWAGSEAPIGSTHRYSEDQISSAERYIAELENFVQRGMEEGVLSG